MYVLISRKSDLCLYNCIVVGLWWLTPFSTIFQLSLYKLPQNVVSTIPRHEQLAGLMVFKSTSDISWRPVLLVEETEVPAENHRPLASH